MAKGQSKRIHGKSGQRNATAYSTGPASEPTNKFPTEIDDSLFCCDWNMVAEDNLCLPGMSNLGNTCFLNSSVQALLHSPSAVDLFNELCRLEDIDSEQDSDGDLKMQESDIEFALPQVGPLDHILRMHYIQAISQSSNSPGSRPRSIKPQQLVRMFSRLATHYHIGEQFDAHEFIRLLVTSWAEEFASTAKIPILESPIFQLFGGYHCSSVTCSQCGYDSTVREAMLDLTLELHSSNSSQDGGMLRRSSRRSMPQAQVFSSVEQALAHYCASEALSGDNSYHCDKCSEKVTASKSYRLHSLPPVLVVVLKRFSAMGTKISGGIQVSESLDLSPFLSKHSPDLAANGAKQGCIYKPMAGVIHWGRSMSVGHYTCVCQQPNGDWVEYDDSSIRPSSGLEDLSTRDAYVLIYQRQGSPGVRNAQAPSDARTAALVAPSYNYLLHDSDFESEEIGLRDLFEFFAYNCFAMLVLWLFLWLTFAAAFWGRGEGFSMLARRSSGPTISPWLKAIGHVAALQSGKMQYWGSFLPHMMMSLTFLVNLLRMSNFHFSRNWAIRVFLAGIMCSLTIALNTYFCGLAMKYIE